MKLDPSYYAGKPVGEKRAFWKAYEHKLFQQSEYPKVNKIWLEHREEFYNTGGYTPLPREDVERLEALRGAYRGRRIFIVGNGPSLNSTPLDLLHNEFTFCVNRFHLMHEKISWKPSFYTITDRRVVKDIAHEVNALTGSKYFFDDKFRGMLREGEDTFYFQHTLKYEAPEEEFFSTNASRGVRVSNTVVGVAIQIAFHLGFSQIYLIGCDLGYKVLETVEQEGDDVFKMGVAFDLKSTKDDDPNHFDPRYFGKDRLWHAPNVKGMVEHHEHYRAAVEARGVAIRNATVGGELEAYDRVVFDDLFESHDFQRDDRIDVDETEVVAELVARQKPGSFMLDVGACGGGSAAHFVKHAWNVICFEPDPKNREQLSRRFARNPDQVTIDPRALSNKEQLDVPFYSSAESKGISGLLAFRDSHQESARVHVVTGERVVREYDVREIEFLKIDVEGHDLNVLRGMPWDVVRPAIIECEFEDAKTEKLGHTWLDLAEFLKELDYTVYISEWHPIIRYGTQHDWRRVFKFGDGNAPAKESWGNMLAFRSDPGMARVLEAFSRCAGKRNEKGERVNAPLVNIARPVAAPPVSPRPPLPQAIHRFPDYAFQYYNSVAEGDSNDLKWIESSGLSLSKDTDIISVDAGLTGDAANRMSAEGRILHAFVGPRAPSVNLRKAVSKSNSAIVDVRALIPTVDDISLPLSEVSLGQIIEQREILNIELFRLRSNQALERWLKAFEAAGLLPRLISVLPESQSLQERDMQASRKILQEHGYKIMHDGNGAVSACIAVAGGPGDEGARS